ncbi:bifunctional metallophosphatase/5'-nucleotidase [Salinarimonas rosea]|uniref:bifunctional metallophosphatase/5'-nucleotidase n=1 Tax=Salinarimonas rosea TaxID=552063 RepID=UPI0003F572AF|nr:bifunctional UDP-sugar hydrolase/5'-nucleotidase [Salinarimonas rosea]
MFNASMRGFLAGAAILATYGVAAAQETNVTISFVSVNDIDRMGESRDGRGGVARLAAVLEGERAENPNTFLIHAGDTISPCLLCGFDNGAHMIALFNELDPAVFVPGNHEFDFGPEVYLERAGEATFPILAANLRGADGQPLAGHEDGRLVEVEGVKIGFFGLVTATTTQVSSPGDLQFADELETAAAQGEALREAGADIVVAVAHSGMDVDFEMYNTRVADVILTGHDHDLRVVYNGRTAMVESSSQADYVVVTHLDVTVEVDGAERDVSWRPRFEIVDSATVEPNAEIAAIVEGYEAELSEALDVAIGDTAIALDSRRASVRSMETAIGNVITDAMRAATDADVALTNGGGIRADRTYDPGTTLTRRDVFSELPFGNTTVLVTISGEDLKLALEHGYARLPEPAGSFAQISGMSVVVDPSEAPGSRVQEVTIGGEPLDPNATYRLATNDFLLRGGDGYGMLANGETLVDAAAGQLMASQVIDYIAANDGIGEATVGERIVVQE